MLDSRGIHRIHRALDDTGSGTPLLRATTRATTLHTEFTLANSCTPSWFLGAPRHATVLGGTACHGVDQ